MLIDDEVALRDWLIATLEPLCDAEPEALARYVLALVSKDKPIDKLRENCIDRLDVFLCQDTANFVDQLFDVIRNRRYISEGKKENVQPKASEPTTDTSEILELTNTTKDEDHSLIESHPIPTTTTVQSVKRRYSPRGHDDFNRYPTTPQKRHSETSPPAKRTQRSHSYSSVSSSPPLSSPKRTNAPGIIASLDFERPPYDVPSSHFHHQYNPEAPDLDYNPYQPSRQPFANNPPRTLVTVVTNAEPLLTDQKLRQHDSNHTRPASQRMKRHVITASSADNRARQRPWHKSNGSGPALTTLEIRKIPAEFNTISKLNEHFSKFGTVTNVQIAYDGSSDSALIAYGTYHEAETAYKNPEPLFNNRFIKIFWHKGQNTPTNPTPPTSDARPAKKPVVAPHPAKLHWSKTSKTSELILRAKKRTTLPPGPSIVKKEAAKKAAIEIRRKKTGLLEEQIQQQKLLLKKLETAETAEEKESIRSLMKQIDSAVTIVKDALRTSSVKSTPPVKLTPQDLLKQRAQILQKQLETLRAKTSADMRRAITNTLETKITNRTEPTSDAVDQEDRVLADDIDEEAQLLD